MISLPKGSRILPGAVAFIFGSLMAYGADKAANKGTEAGHYTVPEQINDGLQTGDPSSVGISIRPLEALLTQIKDGTCKDIHSVLILRSGTPSLSRAY
jgi:hypothetical protein